MTAARPNNDASTRTAARRFVAGLCDGAGAVAVVGGVVDVLGRGWALIVAGAVLLVWAWQLDERRRGER